MQKLDLERLKDIDREWCEIEDSYRLTPYTAPINLVQEKEGMLSAFTAGRSYNPQFEYDTPPEFPVERIFRFLRMLRPEDSFLDGLYYRVAQYELLAIQAVYSHAPSDITGYTALLHGTPDNELLATARSILVNVPAKTADDNILVQLTADEAAENMQTALVALGLKEWSAQPFSPMSAKVSVNRKDKLIKIRENATFTQSDVRRLLIHEIGVHVIRAENGAMQPLGIFSRGLPGYLTTEEGLAVYSEERAGVIESNTLRKYAGRAVAAAVSLGHSFNDTFREIVTYLDPDTAFEIVARAKRGFTDTSQLGAHTKDLVYLKGYREVSSHLAKIPDDYNLLFVGKIGLRDLEITKWLIDSGFLHSAVLKPDLLVQ